MATRKATTKKAAATKKVAAKKPAATKKIATKKSAAKTKPAPANVAAAPKIAAPAGVPAMLEAGDFHSYVAKAKASLAKKASLSRMDPLYDAVELAWFLTALDRGDEAKPLLDWIIAGVPFKGNYSTWSPAGAAICLRARLARIEGDEAMRASVVNRLVANPAYATVERPQIDDRIADDAQDIDVALADKSQKWACHRLGRALMGLSYFRETAGAGFYYDDWIDTAAVDAQIDRALWMLRQRLG